MDCSNLLANLKEARWATAFRTFGNSHATLIGTIVDWWVSMDSCRWALDGGPSFGHLDKGKGGGLCDAILGEGDYSRGVVEVEGTRYHDTIIKMGKFLESAKEGIKHLEFGIFLAYAYSPRRYGEEWRFDPLPLAEFIDLAKPITQSNPGKHIVILALDKLHGQTLSDPRSLGGWYLGCPLKLQGAHMANGEVIDSGVLACQ